MPKKVFDNYLEELEYQKKIWDAKASLREIYELWYKQIVSKLSAHRPVVELGSGCGNFKAFFPETIATDMIKCGDHIADIIDAMNMSYQENSIGNFVMIDCLHHLPRPLKFIESALKALKPGGRIVIFEPACTAWGRFIFNNFHHETLDLNQEVFADNSSPIPENKGLLFNNMAMATIIFIRQRDKFEKMFPDLMIREIKFSDFFVYPATGGFGYFNLIPSTLLKYLWNIEYLMLKPFSGITGMRLCIVLEKKD